MDQYKNYIYRHLKLSDYVMIKNINEDLIEINKILELIRSQEEEFIFFVNLASSKIINYSNKTEYYYSLIFLNEILDPGLKEKEFIIIWRSLFNIFFNNMEFKHIFDKEENLFDIFFMNNFMYEIMSRFSHVIEIEDYYQLLENYEEIDNFDILFYLLENNDKLIVNLQKNKNFRKDKIFEYNVNLVMKLIDCHSKTLTNYKNSANVQKINSCIIYLKNLLDNLEDFSQLSLDSLTAIHRVIKVLYEYNMVEIFQNNLKDTSLLHDIVTSIVNKMMNCLPKTNDQKWELFIFTAEYCIKTALSDNQEIQKKFMNITLDMFKTSIVPHLKYKDIFTILSGFYSQFIGLKNKYEEFWIDVFRLFAYIFGNNEELYNSPSDMELLWNLFVKKYLISFVDLTKKGSIKLSENIYKPVLVDLFNNVKQRGKFKLI
jgi:hypothetical protein